MKTVSKLFKYVGIKRFLLNYLNIKLWRLKHPKCSAEIKGPLTSLYNQKIINPAINFSIMESLSALPFLDRENVCAHTFIFAQGSFCYLMG